MLASDIFILVVILVISSLLIKKYIEDISWLVFNIAFWIFMIIGLILFMFDKYLAFIVEVLIGFVCIIFFLIYKSQNLSDISLNSKNNISMELLADPNSFKIFLIILTTITLITIISFFLIKKFNFKTNRAESDPGEEGEMGPEGDKGLDSTVLNKPNNIIYENLKVMANDYYIKRKKQIMNTWDYNNRKLYYKNNLPAVFVFDEREKQLRNLSFYDILKRICNSTDFNNHLKYEIERVFSKQKSNTLNKINPTNDFEYRNNIEYQALQALLEKMEPAVYSAIDQICPNDLNDKYFLGIKFLDEDMNYDLRFYDLIKRDSIAYKDNIWGWGRKNINTECS